MKWFCFRGLLLLCLVIGLAACASTTDVTTDTPLTTSGPVPGEKTSDEGISATAGPGSAGAGVRW